MATMGIWFSRANMKMSRYRRQSWLQLAAKTASKSFSLILPRVQSSSCFWLSDWIISTPIDRGTFLVQSERITASWMSWCTLLSCTSPIRIRSERSAALSRLGRATLCLSLMRVITAPAKASVCKTREMASRRKIRTVMLDIGTPGSVRRMPLMWSEGWKVTPISGR